MTLLVFACAGFIQFLQVNDPAECIHLGDRMVTGKVIKNYMCATIRESVDQNVFPK